MRYEGMPNTSNPFLPLLQEAGLIYGVNLHYMELDRDRRAVVQKHDIENKVADVSIYIYHATLKQEAFDHLRYGQKQLQLERIYFLFFMIC